MVPILDTRVAEGGLGARGPLASIVAGQPQMPGVDLITKMMPGVDLITKQTKMGGRKGGGCTGTDSGDTGNDSAPWQIY